MSENIEYKEFSEIPMQIFDIQGKGYHFFVNANYRNDKLNFLIDSGASLSLFDFSILENSEIQVAESGKTYEAQGVGNTVESYAKIFDKINISGKEIDNYEAVAIDLSEINQMFTQLKKQPLDGILGADILFKTNSIIDFQNQELSFNWQKFPLIIDSYPGGAKHVFIEIEINGVLLWMALDSAASHTVFALEIIEQKLNTPLALWELNNEPNVGLGKQPSIKNIFLKNIDFGNDCIIDLQLFQLDLTSVNEKYKALNIPEIHGILGCDWLLKNSSIIDFQQLLLKVQNEWTQE